MKIRKPQIGDIYVSDSTKNRFRIIGLDPVVVSFAMGGGRFGSARYEIDPLKRGMRYIGNVLRAIEPSEDE